VKFIVKNIILLELNFKDDIIQENSIIIITVDAAMIVNDIVGIVNNNCVEEAGIVNDSCI